MLRKSLQLALDNDLDPNTHTCERTTMMPKSAILRLLNEYLTISYLLKLFSSGGGRVLVGMILDSQLSERLLNLFVRCISRYAQ